MGVTTRALLGSGLLLAGIGTTTGCAPFGPDCAPPAGDCLTSVDFDGTTYVEHDTPRKRQQVTRLGTGRFSPCDDSSYPGSCPATERGDPVKVFRVPGYDPAEVIALRRGHDRPVATLISNGLSEERTEELRLELAPSHRPRHHR